MLSRSYQINSEFAINRPILYMTFHYIINVFRSYHQAMYCLNSVPNQVPIAIVPLSLNADQQPLNQSINCDIIINQTLQW
jgi:hypothetical protein